MGLVDLHMHSHYSQDADYKPADLIAMALKKDLAAIALTDHNTTAGIKEALEIAKDKDIELIPGIEFDTNYGDNILHIIGYYLDWQSDEISNLLAGVKEAKNEEFYKRVAGLQKLGYQITAEEVIEATDVEPPMGANIAQVLLDKPESKRDDNLKTYLSGAKSDQPYFNFYLDFFKAGGKVDVRGWKPDAKDTIKLILKLGGVPVLAHPGSTLNPDDTQVFDDLKEAGLKGVEAYSTYHQGGENQAFKELATKKDLLVTAGSDFHGQLKPEIELGEIAGNNYQIVERLKELSTNLDY